MQWKPYAGRCYCKIETFLLGSERFNLLIETDQSLILGI